MALGGQRVGGLAPTSFDRICPKCPSSSVCGALVAAALAAPKVLVVVGQFFLLARYWLMPKIDEARDRGEDRNFNRLLSGRRTDGPMRWPIGRSVKRSCCMTIRDWASVAIGVWQVGSRQRFNRARHSQAGSCRAKADCRRDPTGRQPWSNRLRRHPESAGDRR